MEECSRKRKQFGAGVGGGMDTTTKQHQETFSKLLVQRSQNEKGIDGAAYRQNIKGLNATIKSRSTTDSCRFVSSAHHQASIPHVHPDLPLENVHQACLDKECSYQGMTQESRQHIIKMIGWGRVLSRLLCSLTLARPGAPEPLWVPTHFPSPAFQSFSGQ